MGLSSLWRPFRPPRRAISSRRRGALDAQGARRTGRTARRAEPRHTRPTTPPSICGATTMAATSDVCFVEISQDTSLETVLQTPPIANSVMVQGLAAASGPQRRAARNTDQGVRQACKFLVVLTRLEPTARTQESDGCVHDRQPTMILEVSFWTRRKR